MPTEISELDEVKGALLYASNIMDFLIDHTVRRPSKVCKDCEEMVDDFHRKYEKFFPDGHVPDSKAMPQIRCFHFWRSRWGIAGYRRRFPGVGNRLCTLCYDRFRTLAWRD